MRHLDLFVSHDAEADILIFSDIMISDAEASMMMRIWKTQAIAWCAGVYN